MSDKINVLVAKRVMRIRLADFEPATDIRDAIKVYAKFPGATIERTHEGYWVSTGGITDFDESLPLAICKVALRAKGVSFKEIEEALK